ncbi:hypothetical protein EDC04DRAFT_3095015 [Pisolithus marmoratus]|nr:hypothetical protein EDC04DRAFT_3095015 [Pisolithus marmoratus]
MSSLTPSSSTVTPVGTEALLRKLLLAKDINDIKDEGTRSSYPAVLEMELDLLLQKIANPPIVEGLPKLMSRISQKELSHGADIMAGFYTRILQKHYLTQRPTPAIAAPPFPEFGPDSGDEPPIDYSSRPLSPSPRPPPSLATSAAGANAKVNSQSGEGINTS